MLAVDLKRDSHLELLDPHLLKLLRRAHLSEAELMEAAADSTKLRGEIEAPLVSRWLESARRRYLVESDNARWKLTPTGERKTSPMRYKLVRSAVPAGTGGALAAKVLGTSAIATGALSAAGGLVLGLPGIAMIANARRFKRSHTVVRLVAEKDRILREAPADFVRSLSG